MAVKRKGTGVLVSLEGMDGAGKTTLAQSLGNALVVNGFTVIAAREPGGCPLGEELRALIKTNRSGGALATALLFAAARAQLVEEVVAPALAAGHVVLLDRYVDSTWVYQQMLGLYQDQVDALCDLGTHGQQFMPDVTLLLDLPVHMSVERLKASGMEDDRWATPENLAKVQALYSQGARCHPDRIRVVNAAQKPHLILQDAWRALWLSDALPTMASQLPEQSK